MAQLVERIVASPAGVESLSKVEEALAASRHVRIVADDGTSADVPAELVTAIRGIVAAMSHGKSVSVESLSQTLTTQEAADLLGVSRPTLVKYLDQGRIPSQRPGTHRFVRLDDVLAFAEDARRERRAILDEMTRDETANGLRADGFPATTR